MLGLGRLCSELNIGPLLLSSVCADFIRESWPNAAVAEKVKTVAVVKELILLQVSSTGALARLRGAMPLTGSTPQRHECIATGKT
jgi:hypothetical protein